ncbi:hypothetical protein BDC45DRAFT_528281 [Circinella umbellata]|nr:hypothetical protein BDC45DRAFT_528281 [Circinella umbellata]
MEQHMLPASPSTTQTAFHISALKSLTTLRINCQLSVASIVEWLHIEHEDSKIPLPKSIESLLNTALTVYGKLMMLVESINNQRCEISKPDFPCPACGLKAMTPDGDRMVIVMDGNMSLRRFDRVKSHQSTNDPTVPLVNKYWEADDNIIKKPVKASDGCESWRALKKPSTRSKIALDVKGVYGATCSHDFPLAFMNIKTPGERYYISSNYCYFLLINVTHLPPHFF